MSHKSVHIEISPSRMRAFVTVRPEAGLVPEGAAIWENLIETELRSSGVIYGIDREAIADLVKNQKWGEKIVLAKGAEPVPGEHGRVEYLFDVSRKAKPKQTEDGKVDYREINLIQVVYKDDLLARLIPPKEGIPGKTIEGKDVPARAGLAAILQGGLNTYFSDAQKRELRAMTAGSVSLQRGMVQVDSTLTVDGHVDFSSGNLDFTGDIIIRGDVKSGFRVKTAGNIEVHGVVEDALVEAGKDVLIKGGFEGSGRGIIRAGGKVHVKFVENQTVMAQGSIHVGELLLHAQIEAGESVYLTSGKGAIIGGHVKAREAITAKVLGNSQNAPTTVEILLESSSPEEQISPANLANRRVELAVMQEEILSLKTSLEALQRQKLSDKSQAAGGELEMRKLVGRLQPLRDSYDKKRQELQMLERRIAEKRKTGIVTVTQRIFPGVQVIIGEECHRIDEVCGATTLKPSEPELVSNSAVPA
ncbi:MAG TPA: FapA family protein [bacterium]|jgi:uncharacterized protein (DUF342 family)